MYTHNKKNKIVFYLFKKIDELLSKAQTKLL